MARDVVEAPRAPRVAPNRLLSPWPGDPSCVLITARPTLTVAAIEQAVDDAARSGFTEILTNAVDGLGTEPFRLAGFTTRSELVVLEHPLTGRLPGERPALGPPHRAPARSRSTLSQLDRAAFGPFWHLDHRGISAAQRATAWSRTRVIGPLHSPVAYAIWGMGDRTAYLQRLAVHPTMWGHGLGQALVMDGLQRAQRRRARRSLVNTEIDNDRALALYQRCGFVVTPWRLQVLARSLT
jgi:ribosomal protein S18 acetylase RimI-like enzyme